MSIVEFYTNNLVDFYNVDEIKINMNNNNIYIQGDLREYYNKYLKEQEEQVDQEILQKSEEELNVLERKYIQDSLRRLFNEGSIGLELPRIENIFNALIPDINAMKGVNEKLSSSFTEMGIGMKDGATVMGKGAKTVMGKGATAMGKGATAMGKGATAMGKGATVMGKGMKTSYQYIKDQYLKKINKNRFKFILEHLSEGELNELEDYINKQIININQNTENPITVNDSTYNSENKSDDEEVLV